MSRRAAFIALVVIMALTSAWGFGGATRASAQTEQFVTATTDCWSGVATIYGLGEYEYRISAVDGEGTSLGYVDYYRPTTGLFNGTLWYNTVPVDSVTITVLSINSANLGSVTFTVDCFEDEPGCDVGMVPEGSVVGQVNWDAETYWTPGQLTTNPLITLPAGKTAWVLGLDLTREYYKIVWSCTYLWVRMGTMGPNPDALWQSTPLPMRTVK